MKPMIRLALIGLLLAAGPAVAQERCAAAPVASLPLRQQDGHLLVEVEVNARKAVFLLDTGGVTTIISTRMGSRLGLLSRPIAPRVDVRDAGGVRADRYITIRSIMLGAHRITPRNYMIADLREGIDGLLAPDLLRAFDVDLDFAGERMDLYASGACAGTPPGAGDFSSVTMPDGGSARRMRIEALLDGRPVLATLDTGARQSYVAASAAQEFFGVGMRGEAGRARGIFGGQVAVTPHDFAALQIGDIVWKSPRLNLASPEHGFDGAPILLGLQQLQGLRLFAAYSENRLYLSRPGQP
jgi:predicted aspartyl protease